MEMQSLTPAEEPVEVVEEKEEERRQIKDVEGKGAESHVYSGLKSTPEDLYAEAVWHSTKDKPDLQIHRKLRLYRFLCLLLSLSCIILLFAVIMLSVKIRCPKGESEEAVGGGAHLCYCSLRNCLSQHPQMESSPYQPCAQDWVPFEDSCFFLSRKHLNWEDSRKDCMDRGGDLAVITNDRVQNFLTKEGNLLYWFGLRYKREQWAWVNNAALTKSYWEEVILDGDCGLLHGNWLTNQSWTASPCYYHSPYICQTLRTPVLLPKYQGPFLPLTPA